jgi:hypothetical protein
VLGVSYKVIGADAVVSKELEASVLGVSYKVIGEELEASMLGVSYKVFISTATLWTVLD